MPRRRIPITCIPRRRDRRRVAGNAIGAQRRRSPSRRGQLEAIAERRVRALELRKAGCPYREIARQLGVDVRTAHGDIAAELAALREQTVEQAQELRTLELQRLDSMNAGLWPQIRAGSPPAVTAAIRVSERRARLLGLDEPVVTKSELNGSLSVTAERVAAAREQFLKLDLQQMELIAAESQVLVDKMEAMVRANMARANGVKVAIPHYSPLNGGASTGAPAERSTGTDVARSGDADLAFTPDRAQARTPLMLVDVQPSSAAAADAVVTGGPAEQSASMPDGRTSARPETAPDTA